MKRSTKLIFLVTITILSVLVSPLFWRGDGGKVFANNIIISNISLTGQNVALDFTLVQFDISWDNSWRTSTLESNYDAAWIFIKYKIKDDSLFKWRHATLNTTGHTVPAGSIITTPADGKGMFIYRNANGTGSVSFTGAQLRWNYGVDGLADDDSVTVCVFAIEMVYVPTGGFSVGDGTIITVTGQFSAGTGTASFLVTSEGALTLGGGGAGSLGNRNRAGMLTLDDFNDATARALPAAFPKGYNAFYCMKYEITEAQYLDFLNKLDGTQGPARVNTGFSGTSRYTITGVWPAYSTSAPERACSRLNWADCAAYADWAALRPMTELEYEKACRGPMPSTINEYAWGNSLIAGGAYTLINSGLINEAVSAGYASSPTGNASYSVTDGAINGPLRNGIFATAASDRIESGASYYGIMELTGNMWEHCVTVGHAAGRAFTGVHGDGSLTLSGFANAANWPGASAAGTGMRGGSWVYVATQSRVSDRYRAAWLSPDCRGTGFFCLNAFGLGFRAVRIAP